MPAYYQSENLEIKLNPERMLGIINSIDKYCHEETKKYLIDKLEGREYSIID